VPGDCHVVLLPDRFRLLADLLQKPLPKLPGPNNQFNRDGRTRWGEDTRRIRRAEFRPRDTGCRRRHSRPRRIEDHTVGGKKK